MLFLILYWLLSPILWLFLPVIAIINPKIRHHWLHESSSWEEAEKKIKEMDKRRLVVLFHASSTGEFEQLQPILKKIDRSRYFIVLSFFSPTVFEPEQKSALADVVCYHPFDFPWSARFFFRRLYIKYYIITRNDIWPTHLFIAKNMGIHTVLINANLYRKTHYTSWLYRSFFKWVLGQFNLILTSSERLKNNLLNVASSNIIKVSGDSRLDRVLDRKSKHKTTLLPDSYNESSTLILGSIIPSDFPHIIGGIERNYPNGQKSLVEKDHRIIIVPHEVKQPVLKELEIKLSQVGFNYVYFNQEEKLCDSRVIIVDRVGILADLYSYSDIAYVGAGFGAGVHSVLEPVVYNNIVSFGPNFHIVDMAVSLVENNLSSVIKTADDFARFLAILDSPQKLEKSKASIITFIAKQKLATDTIIDEIFNHE